MTQRTACLFEARLLHVSHILMKELLSAVPKKVLSFLHNQGKYVGLSVIVREREQDDLEFLIRNHSVNVGGFSQMLFTCPCIKHSIYQTLQSFP